MIKPLEEFRSGRGTKFLILQFTFRKHTCECVKRNMKVYRLQLMLQRFGERRFA